MLLASIISPTLSASSAWLFISPHPLYIFGKPTPPLAKGDKGGFEIPLNLPLGKGEVRSLLFYYFFLSFGCLGFFTFFLPLVPIVLPSYLNISMLLLLFA
ncbi:MAG: hypothetical protein IIB13_05985 [Chloroflexi bacterium]|nr:hypothetical protein [Chloroflexota bacterium]